jgi:hypothetical protein
MKFTLTIDCDNAAFTVDVPGGARDAAAIEVMRIVSNSLSVDKITEGGTLRDYNGNTVGRFELVGDDE